MQSWHHFGPDHVAALGAIALAALGAARNGRRAGRPLRLALAAALVALLAGELVRAWRGGWFTWETLLPLHLCDLAVLLSVFALLALERRVTELLYFWALTGTLLATVTPDLARGFPSLDYFAFFGLHGLVIVAVSLLVFGLGVVPERGAWRRAFAWTLAYAAGVGVVNLALGTNFLYLRAKPAGATLLDAFGPWPWYIAGCAALALVLFRLLDLPLAWARRRGVDPRP